MAGIISFFGGRAMAWLILGGGGFLVIVSLWSGAKRSGQLAEALQWKRAVVEQVKENREANFRVNSGTVVEQGSLQQQEDAIRQKWQTMGRTPKQELVK
jgi:hypothetical protein